MRNALRTLKRVTHVELWMAARFHELNRASAAVWLRKGLKQCDKLQRRLTDAFALHAVDGSKWELHQGDAVVVDAKQIDAARETCAGLNITFDTHDEPPSLYRALADALLGDAQFADEMRELAIAQYVRELRKPDEHIAFSRATEQLKRLNLTLEQYKTQLRTSTCGCELAATLIAQLFDCCIVIVDARKTPVSLLRLNQTNNQRNRYCVVRVGNLSFYKALGQ